jgi:hypothetical protein
LPASTIRRQRSIISGEANVRFEILVVAGGDDLGLHAALEVGDFLGTLVDEQHHAMHLGVIGGDGVADLLEDRGLAGARRRDDETAGALADGRDEVDDARLEAWAWSPGWNLSIGSMVVSSSKRVERAGSPGRTCH